VSELLWWFAEAGQAPVGLEYQRNVSRRWRSDGRPTLAGGTHVFCFSGIENRSRFHAP
jgi:hypothetical protein